MVGTVHAALHVCTYLSTACCVFAWSGAACRGPAVQRISTCELCWCAVPLVPCLAAHHVSLLLQRKSQRASAFQRRNWAAAAELGLADEGLDDEAGNGDNELESSSDGSERQQQRKRRRVPRNHQEDRRFGKQLAVAAGLLLLICGPGAPVHKHPDLWCSMQWGLCWHPPHLPAVAMWLCGIVCPSAHQQLGTSSTSTTPAVVCCCVPAALAVCTLC